MSPSRRSSIATTIAASVALVLAAAAIVALVVLRPQPESTPVPTSERASSSSRFERPADWSDFRPATHLTPARDWMNDPQRPFFLDGLWHFYYLYNADHPDGNGTAWYHVTSTDLVHWRDEGVAIEKYTNGLGDIWSGSAVVDVEGTAGFGENAVIALVTQQVDGVQRQSLFFSTDGGFSFESYDGNPVMDNPGAPAWRDPKIVWDETQSQWLMLLTEGDKVGFYTSPDLKSWTYRSGFERDDLGVLECPDLFEIAVEGDPDRTTWVLGVSANGEASGRTTGYAYWTGSWDGERFIEDHADPLWLDAGADFYAAVTWGDPHAEDPLASRYAIGWMNNWAYAGQLPTEDWAGGTMSTVRRLVLRDVDGRLSLASQPVAAVETLEGESQEAAELTLEDGASAELPQPASDAYRLRLSLSPDVDDPAQEVRVRIEGADGTYATIGYDFEDETVFLARDTDAVASSMPETYREIRSERLPMRAGVAELDVIVDTTSIEVFAQQGGAALSSLVFLAPGEQGLAAESIGGTTRLHGVSISPLAVAAPDRR